MKKMNFELIRKNKYLLFGLGLVIIIISVSFGIIFFLWPNSNLNPPIIIESDEDFLIYDFIGNGTQDNPYIIENYRIGASGANSYGISISNTNNFFIIKNCIVYTDYIGIGLMNVATGTAWIINNTCISKSGEGGGIFLSTTTNCSIKNNICSNFMQGIHFNYVSHCLIQSNIIENINYQGINIRYSSYSIIINNTIKMAPQHGIAIVGDANSNKIYDNILIDNAYSETYEIDGRLFGSINSQAFDEGSNNYWYDNVNKRGNWWSDYQGVGNYTIDGPAGTEDKYPFEIN